MRLVRRASDIAVRLVAFHIDSREWTRRTNVFAVSASDAFLSIYGGYLMFGISRFYHDDSAGRAVALAVAAADAIAQHHAVVFDPHGMTNLDSSFVSRLVEMDSASGTHIGAGVASGRAVTEVERHLWLHKGSGIHGRAEHMLRTSAYAQLACGAMLGEMLETDGACRTKGRCPLRYLLVFYHRQATIAFAAGCGDCFGGCYDCRSGEKRAAALIYFFSSFLMRKLQADSAL